jgi:hypothetical protein
LNGQYVVHFECNILAKGIPCITYNSYSIQFEIALDVLSHNLVSHRRQNEVECLVAVELTRQGNHHDRKYCQRNESKTDSRDDAVPSRIRLS